MKINGTNLAMTRGDSETITIKVKEGTDYVNLEFGDTIYFTVKINTNVAEKLIQKVITAFDAGVAVIEIEPEDTKNLAPRGYQYDIQWVDKNGRVTTIVAPSVFKIEPDVTFE